MYKFVDLRESATVDYYIEDLEDTLEVKFTEEETCEEVDRGVCEEVEGSEEKEEKEGYHKDKQSRKRNLELTVSCLFIFCCSLYISWVVFDYEMCTV